MEEKISLNGIIDMHVHTAPDVCQRTYNDLELTAAAVRAGARAIVIKGHHCSTVARAALCNAYNRMAFDSNSFVMYGGLVLNYEVGGLNPQAVQTALEMGAKVIWLPTVDAENDCRKHGRSGGIRMTNDHGVLLPELRRTFRPEFLNRIDDIIVFRALNEQDIEEVARRMLKTVENRMESMDIHLDATEEAVKELAREGFDPKYGARPLRRAIQSKVEDAVAEKMLDGTLNTGDTAKLTVEDGKLVVTK